MSMLCLSSICERWCTGYGGFETRIQCALSWDLVSGIRAGVARSSFQSPGLTCFRALHAALTFLHLQRLHAGHFSQTFESIDIGESFHSKINPGKSAQMAGIAQWGEYTPSNTTANTSQTLSKSAQPALPPPQTFDILPPLHELLARIDHVSVQNDLASNNENDDSHGIRYLELQPLDPKDLPAEILPLKSKIRKALRELENLPDMDRSIEDQQEEIAELIQRQAMQEAMIKSLSAAADGMKAELAKSR
nr:hypothetical protein CFP56_38935 [Quercus suber]